MKSTLLFSILSSFALLTASTPLPQPQTTNTALSPTPTHASASTSMTGTPATQPSFPPGNNDNGVSSVPIETVLAVVFGAVLGLGLLIATVVIVRRISRKKGERVKGGKIACDTDGESVFTEGETESEKEVEVEVKGRGRV